MKKFGLLVSFLAFVFLFNLMFSACKPASKPSEDFIDRDSLTIDSVTGLVVLKNDREKIVSGTYTFKQWDEVCEDTIIVKVIVENGVINQINHYYLDGSLFRNCIKDKQKIDSYWQSGKLWTTDYLNKDGQDSIRYFYESDGSVSIIKLTDLVKKEYTIKEFENGLQSKEYIFNENHEVIKSYDFDEYGHKIIPEIDKLELVEYQSGFYRYTDYNKDQVLYRPMVLMKWKNVSAEALSNFIRIEGVFISGSEELSKDSDLFQSMSGAPLESGFTRQASFKCSVGFVNPLRINGADVKCHIYINKQLYKTIKIENKFLSSNRIQ